MMRQWLKACLLEVLFLWVLLMGWRVVYAQSTPNVTATPNGVTLTGTLPDGLFAASLRLSSSAAITNV